MRPPRKCRPGGLAIQTAFPEKASKGLSWLQPIWDHSTYPKALEPVMVLAARKALKAQLQVPALAAGSLSQDRVTGAEAVRECRLLASQHSKLRRTLSTQSARPSPPPSRSKSFISRRQSTRMRLAN